MHKQLITALRIRGKGNDMLGSLKSDSDNYYLFLMLAPIIRFSRKHALATSLPFRPGSPSLHFSQAALLLLDPFLLRLIGTQAQPQAMQAHRKPCTLLPFPLVTGFFFQASAQMPTRGIYSDVTLPYLTLPTPVSVFSPGI
jgi:hypothetical protein